MNQYFKHIYFIGVGGIGMSALARYFNNIEVSVFGYDKTPSPLTEQLAAEGIEITFEDEVNTIPKEINEDRKSLIVYTPAIPASSKILSYFRDQNYVLKKRAEVLGIVTNQTYNLSVAGTHGKTTTSCMISSILLHSSVKFSAFLGGISANLGSNYFFQNGKGRHYSISEADEFDRSFLHLFPVYALVTSTDADHLDIYGTSEEIEKSFTLFSEKVVNRNHRFYAKGKANGIDGVSYSASDNTADYYASEIVQENRGTYFSISNQQGDRILENLYLNIPGHHNLENAVGASVMCLKAGLESEVIAQGLKNFAGIKRRFEVIIDTQDLTYIDDYAHHPSELDAIISSVRDLYPTKKITTVFQPHLFSRTQDFLDGFAESLSKVDELIIIPIYPAREKPIEGVTSNAILEKVTLSKATVIEKEKVLDHLKECNLEVLLTLGAGDIDRLVQPIKQVYGN